MYPWYISGLLAASVPAWTSPLSKDSDTMTKIAYRWDMRSDRHGIAAFDKAGSLLDAACDNALATGGFAINPISFHMSYRDRFLTGNVSVGNSKTSVDCKQPECPRCGVVWNDDWAEIVCQVRNYKLDQSQSDLKTLGSASPCFSSVHESERLLRGDLRAGSSRTGSPANGTAMDPSFHSQNTDASIRHDTIIVNDGNPHQRAWNYQCTKTLKCGVGAGCATAVSDVRTLTWSFMATATLTRWISAGFNVGMSKATSENYNCNRNENQRVCVWHEEEYTSYTVQNVQSVCSQFGCSEDGKSDYIVVDSPNNVQVGDHFYCARNDECGRKGDGYFRLLGAGGPP